MSDRKKLADTPHIHTLLLLFSFPRLRVWDGKAVLNFVKSALLMFELTLVDKLSANDLVSGIQLGSSLIRAFESVHFADVCESFRELLSTCLQMCSYYVVKRNDIPADLLLQVLHLLGSICTLRRRVLDGGGTMKLIALLVLTLDTTVSLSK